MQNGGPKTDALNQLRLLLDATEEGIFGLDTDCVCTFCNRSAVELLGFGDASALVGKQVHPLIHHTRPDGSPYPLEECRVCQAFLEGRRVHIDDEVLWRPDGTSLQAEYWSHPMHQDGRVVGCVVSFLDITERKRTTERLRLIESAVEHAYDAIVITTPGLDPPEPKILYANPAVARMTGFTPEETLGESPRLWQGPNTDRTVLRQLRGQLERGAPFVGEVVNYRKDGSEFVGELRIEPVRDPEGTITHWVAIKRDITERKQAEAELARHRDSLEELVRERTAQLQAVNAELSQYAHVVSHDIRAPLRAIHNYADFLSQDLGGTLAPEQTSYLEGLLDAVHHADALVSDLFRLCRLGQQPLATTPVALGPFLSGLVAELRLSADVRVLAPDDWPVVAAEPVLLRQIFQNLIDNAVKFNLSASKRVELGWHPADAGGCECFVRDNGIGIGAAYREQIFRVFERLHTSEEYEGTGIGLALVKKGAELLRGSVRLESEPGQGSTFYVSLPLAGHNDAAGRAP